MANVIREDVIQLSFDLIGDGLKKAVQGLASLQNSAGGSVQKDLKNLKTSMAGTSDEATKLAADLKKVGGIDNLDNATADLAQLNQKIEVQEQLCKNLTDEYQKVSSEMGETSTKALKLKQSLLNQESNLTKMTRESKSLSSAIENVKNASAKAEDGVEGVGEEINESKENADKLKTSLKGVAGVSFSKLTSGLKGLASGLKKIASISFKAMTVGIAAVGAGVVKVANLASDLEETKNKVDVAFGSGLGDFDGSAKDVMEWSKTSTTSMGLAQQTALDTAALFGDMGTSMGLTKDEAAKMSMTLTQQAADLASFKNLNIEEATTALNGVFTGETESLKRLGVVMTQTNLEQYALSKGISKSIDEMTEAEKVQLRYNYVMEKTKNATGDYVRTGGGFANQLRTLTENFKQLGTVIGAMPMKKLASGMKVVNDALAEVQELLADGFQESDTDKILDIVDGLVEKGTKALTSAMPKVLKIVGTVFKSIAKAAVKALPKIAPQLASGVVKLMISLGKIIISNIPELLNAAKEVVAEVVKALYEGFTGKEMGGSAFESLRSKIDKVFSGIQKIVGGAVSFVKGVLKTLAPVLSFIGNLAIGIFTFIGNNINWLLPLVAGIVAAFWAYKVVLTAVKVITTIVTTVQGIMATVCGTASATAAAGTTAVGAAASVSAPQILAFAAAILAVGIAILAVCAGFYLLAQAAISIANAGWGAVAVMAAMIVVIAGLAVGAAILGPILTAGTVGFLAFGAAVLMVGAAFALIGVGAMLAGVGLQLVAAVLPTLVTYGLDGSKSIIALGASLTVFGAGATVAGAACLVLGAGLLVVSAEILAIAAGIALMSVSSVLMATSFAVISATLPIVITSMSAFLKSLTPFSGAVLVATVPLTAFSVLILALAAAFTVLAATTLLTLVALTGINAMLVLMTAMVSALVLTVGLLNALFASISTSALMLSVSLLPLTGVFAAITIPIVLFTATITPLSAVFAILGASALVFTTSMLVLTATITAITALTALLVVSFTMLTTLFATSNGLILAISASIMVLTMSLTMLSANMLIMTPALLAFTAALLPLSGVMIALMATTLLFTATMAALSAVFVILAPMAMLFAVSLSMLTPLFAILREAVPIFAKALKPLPEALTALILPTTLLMAVLVPLTAEFVALAASGVVLLASMTGLSVIALLIATLFRSIVSASLILVKALAKISEYAVIVVPRLLMMSTALLAMQVPIVTVAAMFSKFASAVMIAAIGSKTIINAMQAVQRIFKKALEIIQMFTSVFVKNFDKLTQATKTGCSKITKNIQSAMRQIVKIIGQTNLYNPGVQMINGLIRGMNSKKSAAISTARSIAQAINREYRKVQDINSPSGEWESYGEYQILGDIRGMEKMTPKLQSTVQDVGSSAIPYVGSYTPENSTTYSSARSTEYNSYSPQFSLSITGATDERSMYRKVKRWIKESTEEVFDEIARKNPKTQEA